MLAGAFALGAPQCLGRLEQSSPELERLWLSKVREAMPIWRHGCDTTIQTVTLPVAGLIGYALMLWREPARSGAADPLGGGRACSPRSAPPCSAGRPAPGPAAQLLVDPRRDRARLARRSPG